MKRTTLLVASGVFALAPGSALAENRIVEQRNKNFSPSEITVKVGDTVTFINRDKHTHNVYSRTKGHEFNFRSQKPGEKNAVELENYGTIKVKCAMHPKMRMKIVVK